jgi:hypothetical protein
MIMEEAKVDSEETDPRYSSSLKIGIIVDSSLNALQELNAGVAAIAGDWFLPKNMTLIYASAPSQCRTRPNRLVPCCL